MKKTTYIAVFVGLALLLSFAPSVLYGYYYNEATALRKSFPYQDGEVVFERAFPEKKVVIWKVGNETYATLIDRKWGGLYQVNNTSSISRGEPGDVIRRTWSARLTNKQRYDTILAVEVIDPSIKKVIVSNEGSNRNLADLNDVREQSSIFIEMDVVNGYAASYADLSVQDAGNFVFRGLNEKGEIVSTKW